MNKGLWWQGCKFPVGTGLCNNQNAKLYKATTRVVWFKPLFERKMFRHIDKKHSSLKRLSTIVKLLTSLYSPLVPEEYTCFLPSPCTPNQSIYPAQEGVVNGMPWFWGILVICLSPKGRKGGKCRSWKIICGIISNALVGQTRKQQISHVQEGVSPGFCACKCLLNLMCLFGCLYVYGCT